ncbi:hypothetical protein B296_00035110, partial [Ensete ventricosum]
LLEDITTQLSSSSSSSSFYHKESSYGRIIRGSRREGTAADPGTKVHPAERGTLPGLSLSFSISSIRDLYYILETSVYPREPEVLKELRQLTATDHRQVPAIRFWFFIEHNN